MTINILSIFLAGLMPVEDPITKEIDLVWAELTRTVAEGDYEGYEAVYHPDAVLVNGFSKKSYHISKALLGWKKGFDDTKEGKMKAGATFKFTQRLHDEESAHEIGMFHYYTINEDGKRQDQYVYMNALLVKKEGKWLLLMEYQKSAGTKADWEALQ